MLKTKKETVEDFWTRQFAQENPGSERKSIFE
jgi:hypothetical protein